MAKTFRVLIQGIEDAIEVIERGANSVASLIPRHPERFNLSKAVPGGIVAIENVKTHRSLFYKIAESRTTLYPITPGAAAAAMQMAGAR